ncbi:MAG: hypothetical protein M3N56_08975 [Actinomycetota bacterium]|nr:hypothetical protein [Actinomycetota bacterium]
MKQIPQRPGDISERSLYWLAGLLEGEGSFMKGPPSSPGLPVIRMVMIDRDVVERAASMLGCGVGTVRHRRSHWKESYAVTVRGARAVEWMQALRPLFGSRRQVQIDRAVKSYAPRSNQRLEDDAARAALEMLGDGRSVKAVAKHFDVTAWCIYDLRLGRTHKHLPRGTHPDGRNHRLSHD